MGRGEREGEEGRERQREGVSLGLERQYKESQTTTIKAINEWC